MAIVVVVTVVAVVAVVVVVAVVTRKPKLHCTRKAQLPSHIPFLRAFFSLQFIFEELTLVENIVVRNNLTNHTVSTFCNAAIVYQPDTNLRGNLVTFTTHLALCCPGRTKRP